MFLDVSQIWNFRWITKLNWLGKLVTYFNIFENLFRLPKSFVFDLFRPEISLKLHNFTSFWPPVSYSSHFLNGDITEYINTTKTSILFSFSARLQYDPGKQVEFFLFLGIKAVLMKTRFVVASHLYQRSHASIYCLPLISVCLR